MPINIIFLMVTVVVVIWSVTLLSWNSNDHAYHMVLAQKQFDGSGPAINRSILSPSEIFELVRDSVLRITNPSPSSSLNSTQTTSSPSPCTPSEPSLGSGFVFDNEGHILTNSHVVGTSKVVVVTLIDGNQYDAEVIGRDPINDIAVLRITEKITEPLQALEIGNSSNTTVGEPVVAIGNPYGLTDTLTGGLVSQIGRLVPELRNTFPLPNMIQTDAIINPGNSGGPLFNLKGEVIGMNTALITPPSGGGITGLGFAISSETLLRIVPVLIDSGNYSHPWLGLSGTTLTSDVVSALNNIDDDERDNKTGSRLPNNFKGVLVDSIVSDGPATRAGIKGEYVDQYNKTHGGDIIIALDGHQIKDLEGFISYIEDHKAVGEKIIITIYRDGQTLDISATLAERPLDAPSEQSTTTPS